MGRRLRGSILAPLALSFAVMHFGTHAHGQGTPIGFLESFALAEDRAATLAKLIPGTAEHFYYSCLVAEHEGRLGDIDALLKAWIERHGRSERTNEIENRQAILRWKDDPTNSAKFLENRLGLSFQHQRETQGVDPQLPTRLDQRLISDEVLRARALQSHPNSLDGFDDSALRSLAASELNDARLTNLLQRLREVDIPNLATLVVRQLRIPRTGEFGTLNIHRSLLLEQLDQCAANMPELLANPQFVDIYLQRLKPGPDESWQRNTPARDAYLTRLQNFVMRLSGAFNSLKAHVLYHRLQFDLSLGNFNEELFKTYLRLPRRVSYINPKLHERVAAGTEFVDLSRGFATALPPIGSDEELVRTYCEHFFIDAGSFDAYAELLHRDWVRRVFAETKILHGIGDMQRWYALLNDPGYYEQLRDRVEIRFAPTAPTYFAVDQPVALDLELKNAGKLLVKVFEIHMLNFHREQQTDIDATIDLDGFVANEERTLETESNPLRRTSVHLEFPNLNRRGTWVIEIIGNGISSRALIEKGRLAYIERASSAGQLVRVLDEAGQPLEGASLLLGGREFTPDKNGEILVPWSTSAGAKQIILRYGEFSTIEQLQHRAESYTLQAAIHIDRETLLPGRRAPIIVRPRLLASGFSVPVGLLEEPRLTITATDHDGVATSLDVPEFELFDDRDSLHEILVPEGLAQVDVRLSGRVQGLSEGKTIDLSSSLHRIVLNRIDATPATHCSLLGRTSEGFMLDVLGKDGEPKADRAVSLTLKHRHYNLSINHILRTDAKGRVELGALEGIESILVNGDPAGRTPWTLRESGEFMPRTLHGVEGEAVRVPWPARYGALTRDNAGLLQLIDDQPLHDAFDRLSLNDGYLEARGLVAGDYSLRLGAREHLISVSITRGPRSMGWAHGEERRLELRSTPFLQIQDLSYGDEAVQIRLGGTSADTRVHVFVTRYVPAYSAFSDLMLYSNAALEADRLLHAESSYHAGRTIGDEYRYILDRRSATKYPGNMLRRPGILLNPWALDEEQTALGGEGSAGGGRGGKRGGRFGGPSATEAQGGGMNGPSPATFPNLVFLPQQSAVFVNLRPDANGIVRIERKDLGTGQQVHVVALDARNALYRSLALPETPLVPKPQRLARALDSTQRLAEQQRIDFIAGGGEAVIADRRVSKLETFGSLAEVHRLYRTLSSSEDLAAFSFLLRWSELPRAEKLTLYSKYACHELHFFLYRKDRAFFDEIVRPYLANKAAKTFLDEWLLDADLSRYLESYAFSRLNTVERILLAQRFPAERENVARLLRETIELQPEDPEKLSLLFRSALQGDALDRNAALMEREELQTGNADGAPMQDRLRAGRFGAAGSDREAEKAPGAPPAKAAPSEDDVVEEVAEDKKSKEDSRSDEYSLGLGEELERRKSVRQLYRAPETTKRYVETNYWKRRIEEHVADLITPNAYWLDYANAAEGTPFVSPHFVQASGSFAEMLLALAVLDLPLRAEEPEIVIDGIQLTLKPKSPILLVRQEIAPALPRLEETAPILVSQNFFRLDDRYRHEGNEQRDNYITKEFLIDVAYGAQIVVTNPTSAPRKLDLLLQVPAGAIPVRKGFFTRGVHVVLGAYSTQSIEYAFYFPAPGVEPHYPVHVSSAGAFVAAAEPVTLNVLVEPSTIDTSSWAYVSQNGSSEEVLNFLNTANLQRLDLSKIAWRMRAREFFDATLTTLRARKHFDSLLWSYAVKHRDEASLREYLRHADSFLDACGSALVAQLVSIDPVERHDYQMVEFEPLFNARAHRFGRERLILNSGVARQYLSLLDVLAHLPRLSDADWMAVTYYLLLQDRVEEALAGFAHVNKAQLAAQLQYDYMQAYLAFYTGDTASARAIAAAHLDHPVERWRARFAEVQKQLDEIDGKTTGSGESDDRTRQQTDLAEREPALELEIKSKQLELRYRNLTHCTVSYFAMDVEFLFSTRPFVDQSTGSFAYVRANHSDRIELAADANVRNLELPAEFQNANLWIEVAGGGIVRRQPFYSNSLAVRWIENYGQLQVNDAVASKPLPRVYVKVYAREPGGKVRFHKDGYTDLRGRFDYASISGEGAHNVERYSVLLLSEEHGALIREMTPPAR